MAISSTTRKAGPFAGDGVTTVFPFTFKVFAASDLVVTRAAAGVETVLALTTNYSVALNSDQDVAPGGSITLTAALAVGQSLTLTSGVPQLQQVVITNGGGFFPSVLNAVHDRLTIFCQQLAERASRQLAVPVTNSTVTSFDVPVVGSAVLQWNAGATALVAQTLPDLSLSLALPSMAGNSGKYLTNNGAVASWSAVDFSSYAAKTTTITGGGLATGGGDLSANRVITVTAAAAADVRTGTNTTKATTVGDTYAGLAEVALTYSGSNIVTSGASLDGAAFINASITLNQNSTIPAIDNPVLARQGRIKITQDAGVARTLAYHANFKFPGGVTPTMTTTLGAIAFLDYDIVTATYWRANLTAMG